MTQHEVAIRAHCANRKICMELLPSGAVRFTGHGVSITTVNFGSITLAELAAYEPRKDHALRNQAMHPVQRIRNQATRTVGL